MPEVLSRYNTFEYNGYLYLLGGTSQSVYYTEILPDGSLGQWQTTISLPEERRGARAGVYNGFVYVAGGYDGSNYQNTVYYAQIDHIILSFPFEDNGGTTTDVSGNGNDGIINGAVFVPGGGISNSNAFQFDWAYQDYIEVPYQESQRATAELTLEAWIYPTAWDNIYAGYNRIISKQPVYLLRGANGHAHFQILTENSGYLGVYADALTLNEWHYLVGTFDGQFIRLYVDGVLSRTTELTVRDTIVTNERPIFIGESPVLNEGFTGIIDNVAIYRRAKPQQEIEETYASIMPPAHDGDHDGVPDNEEMGPDGNDPAYDGNYDGSPDSQQENVTSMHSYDGQNYWRSAHETEKIVR
jgi:hypothetical protein